MDDDRFLDEMAAAYGEESVQTLNADKGKVEETGPKQASLFDF